jgi:predicted acyltransferase (DUF342 family)
MVSGAKKDQQSTQSGAILMYIVGTMVILAVLGAAMVSFFGAGTTQTASPNCRERARFVAEGGLRYAVSQLNATNAADVEGNYTMSSGAFDLEIFNEATTSDVQIWNATVTGYACLNSMGSSNYRLQAQVRVSKENGTSTVNDWVLNSPSTIEVPNKGEIKGDVGSKEEVILHNKSIVDGDVISGSDTELINRSQITGSVCSNGSITLHNEAVIYGNATAHGYVEMQNKSTIYGKIIASEYVTLQNQAEAGSSIDAGGEVNVGHNARVAGNIVSGSNVYVYGVAESNVYSYGDVTIDGGDVVQGDVYATGRVFNDGTVGGEIHQFADPDDLPDVEQPAECSSNIEEPPLAEFTAGGSDIFVPWKSDDELDPDVYGDIQTGGKNTLTLHGGGDNYYADSLSIGTQTVLRLDLSAGEIRFFSVGDITLGDKLNILVSTDGTNYMEMENVDDQLAMQVYFETHGNANIFNKSDFFGTLLVANDLSAANGNQLIGGYYALGEMQLGNEIDVTYVPSNYAEENW